MAKKKQPVKNQKPQNAKGAGKSASPGPRSQAAQTAVRKPQPSAPRTPEPAPEPGPPVFTPANIAILGAGLALLAVGAVHFYRIQYGPAPTGTRIYFQGFALFAAGILLPCLGIAPLRRVLLPLAPRKKPAPPGTDPGDSTDSQS